MRRTVRIKLDYLVTIDDDRDGIPFVKGDDVNKLIIDGLKAIVPDGYLHGGAKIDLSLTRESMAEARRRRKHATRRAEWLALIEGMKRAVLVGLAPQGKDEP